MATLDREAQAVLDRIAAHDYPPPDHTLGDDAWTARYRDKLLRMIPLAGEPGQAECIRHQIEGDDGPLDLRAYRSRVGVLPGLIYFHGGGFIAGSLDTHEPALRSLATATGAAIIAVEYRRAPEHPFPAAPEDCYATVAHVAANPERFGVNPACIVVAGDSAGGTLAAAVAAMARDRGGPRLAGQVCLYPATDLRTPSGYASTKQWDGTVVSRVDDARAYALYLAGADASHPYASPLLAPDHAGLPAALVITCECDPLRDEGEAYTARLRQAGVPVEHIQLAGMIHGVLQMGGYLGAARTVMADIGRWLMELSRATPAASPR